MNELIKVNCDGEQPLVSGRELHEFLEVETPYRLWFPRMCEYGFSEGADYTPYNFVHPQNQQETTDHSLTVQMAKEICMLQRTEKGKQARQYFIQLETNWNSPEKVMARALQIADRQIKSLTEKTNYQQQVITGLTGAISLDQKRQILNKVMRKGFGSADQQRDRWGALYQHFEMIHHCNVDQRIANWQDRMCKAWKKSKLDFVDKQMGMLDELYTVAVKLFETDVETVKRQLFVA